MTKEIVTQMAPLGRYRMFFLTNKGNIYVLKFREGHAISWKNPWSKIHTDKIFRELERGKK